MLVAVQLALEVEFKLEGVQLRDYFGDICQASRTHGYPQHFHSAASL